jgi:hypothetical protein
VVVEAAAGVVEEYPGDHRAHDHAGPRRRGTTPARDTSCHGHDERA